MSYDGGRLTVARPEAPDERFIDVDVSALLKLRLSYAEPSEHAESSDEIDIWIHFRSADFVVNGVRSERQPYRVTVNADQLDEAKALANAVNGDLLDVRRVGRQPSDLTVPLPVPGRRGPERADVTQAADRLHLRQRTARAIGAMHLYARPDEYVLELAFGVYGSAEGLLAITTVRLLFISSEKTLEFPVAGLGGAEATGGALKVADGFLGLHFTGGHYQDFERFAFAVTFAATRMATEGRAQAVSPSPVELFAEWQLLLERRGLRMVPDDEYHRQGSGILMAMPD